MRLLDLAIAFLASVYLGLRQPSLLVAMALLGALALAWLLVRKKPSYPVAALLGAALILGLARGYQAAAPRETVLGVVEEGQPVTVEGLVRGTPQLVDQWVRFRLEEAQVRSSDQDAAVPVPGAVLVTARTPAVLAGEREPPFFRSGDVVTARGILERPPVFQDFDYRAYLERQDIFWVMGFPQVEVSGSKEDSLVQRLLTPVRSRLAQGLEAALPEPQGSLAQALLLGLRTDLPQDVVQAFRYSGTSHLLAISGLHVGVVLGLTLAGAVWALGRRRGGYLLVPLTAIWAYAIVSGMFPPVERAAIMGTLYLLAVALGRQSNALPALGGAAAVMVALEPVLLEDVSFQLSFTAVAGLAVVAPPLQAALERGAQRFLPAALVGTSILRGLLAAIAIGAGATLGTLPLLAFYFHRLSLVGLPATLLAVPALPAALGLSLAAAIEALLWAPLGWMAGWLAWLPLQYIILVARLFAQLPGATVDMGPFSGWLVVAYYGALLGLLSARRWRWLKQTTALLPAAIRPAGWQLLRPLPIRPWMLIAAALVAALVWLAALSVPERRLRLTALDVGAGDALLLQTPGGYQVLVDGGPGRPDAVQKLGQLLPFWDRTLNAVVLTHPHQDHIAGLLEVLRRYRVDLVVESGTEVNTAEDAEWRSLTQHLPKLVARRGQELHFPDGTRIRILNPPDPPLSGIGAEVDNAAVVLLVSYGSVDLLLTADIYRASELSLVGQGLVPHVEVLKAAHHGSDTSSLPAFLQAAAPLLTIVSAAPGQLQPEIRSRLESFTQEQRLFDTAEDGQIQVTTDGEALWIETER